MNDSLGHPAGDELIREVGRRLKAVVRETDTVARIGGDEFAVIQTELHTPADTEVLCKRIIEHMRPPFDLLQNQVFVGVTIGVALAPTDALDRIELTRKADIALYNAKTAGRGQYVLFAETMDVSVRQRRATERDLRAAMLAGDQLKVHYQPLYSAGGGEITGMEALVRWQHPTDGFKSPAVFIPVAEESGLIEPLGEWVLREACTAAARWPVPKVAVNVSAVQLCNPNFALRVMGILQETGLAPQRLELEVTETALIESAEQCGPTIRMLRDAGVRIALDDFGTGYSSLSHLRELQVDRVKIDRSFVSGIDRKDDSNAIIQAIVDLAQATGLKVTAERVETQEQSNFLSGMAATSCRASCCRDRYRPSRSIGCSEFRRAIRNPGWPPESEANARSLPPRAGRFLRHLLSTRNAGFDEAGDRMISGPSRKTTEAGNPVALSHLFQEQRHPNH